jgi:hypothetical protein
LAPFGPAVSEEKIFLTLANQKQELPKLKLLKILLLALSFSFSQYLGLCGFLAHLTQRVM